MGLIVLLLSVQIVSRRLNEMLGDFVNGFCKSFHQRENN
jgi:hypothetical protein